MEPAAAAPSKLLDANIASFHDVDVAVVGGGPAGLAAAAALAKVLPPSVSIKVYETSAALSDAGAAVGLHVNGMRALEAIDPRVAHRLYASGNYSSRQVLHDPLTGAPREVSPPFVIDHEARLEAAGHTSTMVYWNDVRTALAELLPEGVLQPGCRLVDCALLPLPPPSASSADNSGDQPDGPLALQPHRYLLTLRRIAATTTAAAAATAAGPVRANTAASGNSSSASAVGTAGTVAEELLVRAKVVIGADGYFSRVRRLLGDGGAPAFSGRVCWRGSFPEGLMAAAGAVPLPAALASTSARTASHRWSSGFDPTERLMLLIFREGDGKGGAGGGESHGIGAWYLQAPVADLAAAGIEYPPPGLASGGLSGPLALSRALAVFSSLPADVRALLAATPPDRVTEHGLHMHPIEGYKQGAWAFGCCVLLGDAAHAGPPDGQGLNLALEDAAVLGAVARSHGGRLGPQVFAEWEALRQPRVAAILGDTAPPFARRMPAIMGAAFEPLWHPRDVLPAGGEEEQPASVEAALEWSRRVVRVVVGQRLAALKAAEGAHAAVAPAVIAASAPA
ncbi:hypothetical protein GPECTOR_9g692 [Gonium pectorale]|uniref:FAD-binding domain-containing protein n=1 Tax=Gonium pectorale TaxID=33097 RepID=A0A150GS30_GONPE|nr:hypothetical protein GPECTOR_9g692 [Gonium pectorale]|eukprot:KXZ52647.1 hypothetical protein GPECTOR_9g692 [Gonium pectorale]